MHKENLKMYKSLGGRSYMQFFCNETNIKGDTCTSTCYQTPVTYFYVHKNIGDKGQGILTNYDFSTSYKTSNIFCQGIRGRSKNPNSFNRLLAFYNNKKKGVR